MDRAGSFHSMLERAERAAQEQRKTVRPESSGRGSIAEKSASMKRKSAADRSSRWGSVMQGSRSTIGSPGLDMDDEAAAPAGGEAEATATAELPSAAAAERHPVQQVQATVSFARRTARTPVSAVPVDVEVV